MSKSISTYTQVTTTVWGCTREELDDVAGEFDWALSNDNVTGIVVAYDELIFRKERWPGWLMDVMDMIELEGPDLVHFTDMEA